ncbi:hypothetical protein QFZ80_000067 [Paenibacillus sp. V4I7]|nr:hypothetical protein [Paenibacillus sp. V4I7]MDQ0913833.1 hypothetical protein [Paenibacillus sp. V4I5]
MYGNKGGMGIMVISMGMGIYEVCPEALEKGKFLILRVIRPDITKA